MKKVLVLIFTVFFMGLLLTGCSSENKSLTMVWYPNESGEDLKAAREEIGKVIEEATSKKVEHKLTTDYVIAIEAIASGNADIAFLGAQGYIEAHKKNQKVLPLVVNSGSSGTLEDAVYYSWLNVKKGNENQYKSGSQYAIDNIQGKRFSFVSSSSTSGFKVPSAGIVSYFSKKDAWKDLKQEELTEGGKNKFFSEVLFGGSHQGSAVNLLTDKADVAAFCDTCVANYVELAAGTPNRPGAVYRVKQDAVEPFDKVRGEEFVAISVTPVLNAPFAYNSETVNQETMEALRKALVGDDVANNEQIFVPKESDFKGLFAKGQRFVEVTDDWFNPIRELSN
ncbi:MAG: phosphonate ABC transporter substrate-binding protein [Clostridiaceae bacterium BRH_c20a]|nr:MAG: phosphonate ABC transporter substrate-binding protein [Clostridiaceae bacterium BRH_c20a]